jgi:hypothetical protein
MYFHDSAIPKYLDEARIDIQSLAGQVVAYLNFPCTSLLSNYPCDGIEKTDLQYNVVYI